MHSEFDLIQQFFTKENTAVDVVLGVGDDAAVVMPPAGMAIVATVDTLIESVHFPAGTAAADIAHKALAVNLSDLAAMAAEPRWFTLALTLPNSDEAWLQAFSDALFNLASRYHVALIGGDTTRGPLSLSIQAMGIVPNQQFVSRQAAAVNDDIYVTGTLGDAALGLQVLQGRAASSFDPDGVAVTRLNRPVPRVELGQALRFTANSMIDVSDGFVADLGHILTASQVGADIRLDRLPLSRGTRAWVEQNEDFRLPLTGGDDYELIFTAAEQQRDTIAALADSQDVAITWVGKLCASPGLRLFRPDGTPYRVNQPGYNHFDDTLW